MKYHLVLIAGMTLLAAGCVEERVVHERPVRQEYVAEVIAPGPPPVEIVEREPEPRVGFVWARGYWHWDGHRYYAVHGHWEGERAGYHYEHPHWEQRGNQWHLHVGAWVRG
jgi:WXXGXW repeat (2 copies)